MSFFKNLFAAKSAKSNTPRLGLEALSAREVPAAMNPGITANLAALDTTPVLDPAALFGKIEIDADNSAVIRVAGTAGRDKVTTAEVAGNWVITLQQLDAAGRATHTQSASFDKDDFLGVRVDLFGGNDVFIGNANMDQVLVNAGDGHDMLTATTGGNLWSGGAGNDYMAGGARGDAMFGGDGDDTMTGGAGMDYMAGGNGNDFLAGGADADQLFGGDGDDVLDGGSGVLDVVIGGSGNDTWI